jgi:hypothetical protein
MNPMPRAVTLAILALCVSSIRATAEDAFTLNTNCKISECAQKMVEIANKLLAANNALTKRIETLESAQRGMIAAFDAAACPPLWTEFKGAQGKFLVGSNGASPDNKALQSGQEGGAWSVIIRPDNLPNFNGSFAVGGIQTARGGNIGHYAGDIILLTSEANNAKQEGPVSGETVFHGKNTPLAFAPPYRAVVFCSRV